MPQEGWAHCRAIAFPTITIYGTAAVSESAMENVKNIYSAITSRLKDAQYPRRNFNGYNIYITNGEQWSDLETLSPVGSMWPPTGDLTGDELRGGASTNYLWISEQMICKTGVATRNQAFEEGRRASRDESYRAFDQVVHEFGHAIDYKYGLRSQINTIWAGRRAPAEDWAWAVQSWYSTPAGDPPAAGDALLEGLFTSATSFSCSNYNP